MQQLILIERDDGGVSTMQCRAGRNVNVHDLIRQWEESVPWKAIRFSVVKPSDLPTDRTWRDAWRASDGTVTIDRKAAEAVHMDRIRAARNRELDRLDMEIARAEDRDGKPNPELRAERQRLRDIPQTFDLSKAATVEDLKALWPEGLPRGIE